MSTKTDDFEQFLSSSRSASNWSIAAVYAWIMGSAAHAKSRTESTKKMRETAEHRAAEIIALVQKLDGDPVAHADLVSKLHHWMASDMRNGERSAAASLRQQPMRPAPATSALSFKAGEALNPENLTTADAAAFLARSEKAVNDLRLQGKVYAMLPAGKEHGFQYPRWQFDADPDRLAAVLEPFVQARVNCWVVHGFFMSESASLEGRSPRDCMLDVEFPVERIVALAQNRLGYTRASGTSRR